MPLQLARTLARTAAPGLIAASNLVDAQLDRLRRVLVRRLQAQARESLDSFAKETMRITSGECQRLPGLAQDDDVAFALEELIPRRVSHAKRHLGQDPMALASLVGFLERETESFGARAAAASDLEEVGDALIDSWDALHSFLMARGVVGQRYRAEDNLGGADAGILAVALGQHPDPAAAGERRRVAARAPTADEHLHHLAVS